jgi:hypothetical protein
VIENSSAGLHMFEPAVPVTVTREEHHQHILARYPVTGEATRRVAVELAWCTIESGKYQGHQAIEVRLDGSRVGELTYAMSQRYAPFVHPVSARGGRPGCEALIHLGKRGIELDVYLPRHTDRVPLAPATRTFPQVPVGVAPMLAPTVPPMRTASPSKSKANHGAAWVVAGVVGVIALIAVIASGGEEPSSAASPTTTTTTSTSTTTTTTPPPTTTETTPPPVTTEAAPAPPAPAPTQAPVTTTRRTTIAPPPPPKPAPTTAASQCDENYSGCVPIASDVDCQGGSGNGPAYVRGPIRVIGSDIYDLDRDGDGVACE